MAYGFTPTGTLPRALRILLIANVALFLIDLATQGAYVRQWLALDPVRTLHNWEVWRLVTYLFVHDLNPPFLHILINMLILWMFGTPLVDTMGERKFWWFYICTGVFSGLCSLVFYSITENPTTVIGASGALFGLMFAFAKFFPTQQFLILFLFPVQARYAVIIFGAVELLSILSNDRIAHITHLGGAVFAWLYFKFEDRGVEAFTRWKNRKAVKMQKAVRKSEEELGQVMVDIDPILKKISQTGMGSLTKEEKDKLERASELKRKAKGKLISLDEYRKRQ
ncbi:MAG TPA: rhomboid family intramembrane serine protease [Fibrobacteria bacterium]|nr:rhomboid family intramembrane serine protease [Fibrobacteria bacterium]